jgi:hypothetical protein
MRTTLASFTLVPALCAGCGGQSAQTVPVALVPCAVPGIGAPDAVWHQVRASGFTFCVPPAWRPLGHASDSIDAKRWHGDGSSVTWDLGRPTASTVMMSVTTEIVGVPSAGRIPPPGPPRALLPQACVQQTTTTPLNLDGVSLLVTQVQCPPTWTTIAWSTAPPIYVKGEAHSGKGAEVLLLIIQTLRFTSRAR